MLPNIEQENEKKGAKKLTPEQREEILDKVLASVNTESMKPVSDTSIARIVTDFARSLEDANKDLIENLVDEDKELLKEVVKEISKLQGKNSEELKRLAELAEKIMLSADKSGNEKLKGVGERLKESVLQEKYKAAGATLTGDQDTFKNRLIRGFTGTTPAEAKLQGTSVFGTVLKDFSYGFRKGLGDSFVSDEERRDRIKATAEYENKKVALAESSAEDFGKILDSANNNSPDQDKFEVGGGEETTNLTNPEAKTDTASKSDIEELKAGIRETDPAFSRSATVGADPWDQRWADLMDMLQKIKDCVCTCQCTGDNQPPEIDLPDRRRPRPGRQQRPRVRGRGFGILAAGAAAAAGVGAAAVGAWNWAKDKLGFGESTVGTPEQMPSTRTAPGTPATEVTGKPGQARPRPGTIDTRSPRTLPTPANDPGVRIPAPANDDDRFVEEQKKRVNERPQYQGPETEERTPPKRQGTAESPTRTRPSAPPAAANDVPNAPAQKPRGGFWSRAWDRVKGFAGFGKPAAAAAGQAAEKSVGRVAAKSAGRSLLKKIPGVSIGAGLLFGAQRAMQGDWVGAGGEVLSGLAGTVPLYGTAASVAIDAGLAARDLGAFDGNTPTNTPTRSQPATATAQPTQKPSMWSRAWNATKSGAGRAFDATRSFAGRAFDATRNGVSRVFGGAREVAGRSGSFLRSAGNSIGRGLGTAGRFAGRVLGKAALPIAAGMALYDGYKGFNADPNATTGQKFLNAGRNIASGLTFGLVDSTEDKIASGEYRGSQVKPIGRTAGLETGRNLDGSVIERGTDMTAKSAAPVINVPPPTVIQAPANNQQSPLMNSGRDYINARPSDSTWLRFQEKRAVA